MPEYSEKLSAFHWQTGNKLLESFESGGKYHYNIIDKA